MSHRHVIQDTSEVAGDEKTLTVFLALVSDMSRKSDAAGSRSVTVFLDFMSHRQVT